MKRRCYYNVFLIVLMVLLCLLVGMYVMISQQEVRPRKVILSFRDSGRFQDMNHLFHFLEHLIVSMSKLRHTGYTREDVVRIEFPGLSSSDEWVGKKYDHNLFLIKTIFPHCTSIEINESSKRNHRRLRIDREKMDKGAINKMILETIVSFPMNDWASIFHTNPMRMRTSSINVVYIDRQDTTRKLSVRGHEELIEVFSGKSWVNFRAVRMQDMNFEQQVGLMRDTDVLVGVHGNGLSHQMFMKPGGVVIEIFPLGAKRYLWDYYTMSLLMKHRYFLFFQEQWSHPLLHQPIDGDMTPPPMKKVDGNFRDQLLFTLLSIREYYSSASSAP